MQQFNNLCQVWFLLQRNMPMSNQPVQSNRGTCYLEVLGGNINRYIQESGWFLEHEWFIHLWSYDADNVLDRGELETTDFAIIIPRLETFRQLQIENKFCVGKESSLCSVEEGDGAGRGCRGRQGLRHVRLLHRLFHHCFCNCHSGCKAATDQTVQKTWKNRPENLD